MKAVVKGTLIGLLVLASRVCGFLAIIFVQAVWVITDKSPVTSYHSHLQCAALRSL